MRGRWPAGPEYVDKLEGSQESKERLKAILDTLYGEARLQEACDQLDISETRIHQLRQQALQAALTAIEPRPAGRPSLTPTAQTEQLHALQERVQQLEQALHESQVREEIALVLPHLGRSASAEATASEGKKMPLARVKINKPR
jgi:hypothetical protein